MKSVNATRWSREAILAIGNVFAFDEPEGTAGGAVQTDPKPEEKPDTDSDAEGNKEDSDDGDDPEALKKKLRNRADQAARQDAEIKRLKEAEKRADELQKKVDEAERKNKTELENTVADLEKANKVIAAKDDTIRRLTIENAFMSLDGIEWHNPATALKLVDLSEVDFDDETGVIKDKKQLIKAAKELAKDNEYLVKSKTDVSKGTPEGKPSGKAPAGQKPKETTKDAIREKYGIRR